MKHQAARRYRHRLLAKIRVDSSTLAHIERVSGCCWRSIEAGGQVGMRRSSDGSGGAGFSGVMRCGSIWACPVCAAKIARERADDLQHLLKWAVRNNHTVAMVTFTLKHNRKHRLARSWNALTDAWEYLNESGFMKGTTLEIHFDRWQHWLSRFGQPRARKNPPIRRIGWAEETDLLGWVRAFEGTKSEENGWHPHLHVIMIFEGQKSAAWIEAQADRLFPIWRKGLARNGFKVQRKWKNDDGTEGGGVHVRVSTDAVKEELQEYFTKFAALELTAAINKKGHRKGRTHWQLAEAAFNDGDWDALMDWRDWVRVSAGRKQLTWSQGLRKLAGMAEKERTDEEIAETEVGDEDLIILTPETWREIRSIQTDLLDVFDQGGVAAAAAWLDARKLEWFVAVKRSEESTNQDRHGSNAPPA